MPRGGRRKGAGRPKNSGKFGEPTKAVRLPVSKIEMIMKLLEPTRKDPAEVETEIQETKCRRTKKQ